MSELPLADLLADLRQRLDDIPSGAKIEVWPVINLVLDYGQEDTDRRTVAHYILWKLPRPSGRHFYSRQEIAAVLQQLETP